jgi:small conductance mechanosensitive channel
MVQLLHLVTALIFLLASTAPIASASDQRTALTGEEIDRVLASLEDEGRREELLDTLRALSAAASETETGEEQQSVRTAAAELVERVATKARDASLSAGRLLETLSDLPGALGNLAQDLSVPEHRQQWLTIAWRLLAILGAGFAAAAVVTWLLRRAGGRSVPVDRLSLPQRTGRLAVRFVLDLAPILTLALVAYGTLTLVDPRQETRLVAVALINASVFSRLVMAMAGFLLSPGASALRLWRIADESANYLYQWTRRLAGIAIYGFFGLQAGLLLGAEAAVYETLLRALGLVVLLMLLILVAQNRREVAAAIASEKAADIDEPAPVSSFRRGLARVWHLLAGAYLVLIYGIWALRIQDGSAYLLRGTLLSIAALAVGRLLGHAVDQLFDKGLRLSEELRQQHPGLEGRLNRYFPALRKLSKIFLLTAVALFIGYAWGIDTLNWVTEGSGRIFLGATLQILLVLAVAFFVWEFASGSIESYLAETNGDGQVRVRSARMKTLLTVARNALMIMLSVVTLLMILSELGLNIAPLLAGAGVVGLAIGFGAQRLVQDVINGAFILFQDLMSVGDVVKLGDKAGVVEALSIRTVRLRDLAGVVHTIPFSSIEAVSNLTREFSFHVFDIGIAYREDVDEVIALIRQIGEELQKDADIGPLILEPLEVFGLDQFGDSAIVIKGRIKTKPIKQWQVGRAFNRLVKQRFDQNNIEIPFPHKTIYFGQDKDGTAPPAFVQFEKALAASQAGADDAPRETKD